MELGSVRAWHKSQRRRRRRRRRSRRRKELRKAAQKPLREFHNLIFRKCRWLRADANFHEARAGTTGARATQIPAGAKGAGSGARQGCSLPPHKLLLLLWSASIDISVVAVDSVGGGGAGRGAGVGDGIGSCGLAGCCCCWGRRRRLLLAQLYLICHWLH